MKDKIIFWLDADLKQFALAKFLQEKYDADFYAIVDITNKPKQFFQDQNIVNFKKIWFYHDYISINKTTDVQYLDMIENKYDLNLWIIAQNERLFYRFNDFYKFSRDEIMSILEQECKLFEQVLDEIKPDFLIIKTTDFHHNHLFHKMCKSRGIKILMNAQARLGYRCTISQELDKFDFEEDLSSVDASGKSFDELEKILKGNNMFKQTLYYKNKYINSKKMQLKAAFAYLLSSNDHVKTHYTYFGRSKSRVLSYELKQLIKKKLRERFLNNNSVRSIDDRSPFVYYPLQHEPERSLLVAAPFYTNQIVTIKNIAMSLPANYRLCVKEHPTMHYRGWRDIEFYKQIIDIPNVDFLHPLIDPHEILTKCSLVITATGTGALEAAFYQKPSIIFSSMNYELIPSIYRLKTPEELPTMIKKLLKTQVSSTILEKFIKIYEKNSFEFDLLSLQLSYTDYFFYGGFLVDVPISISKMNSYLEENRAVLEIFALEHIKKIKQHKEFSLKKENIVKE